MYKNWPLLIVTLLAACTPASEHSNAAQDDRARAAANPAGEPAKGVDRSHKGTPAPSVLFNDATGGEIGLGAFRGIPVLVNLWASWCAPCVKELPTLNALSKAQRKDGRLGVVAVSQDSAPQPSVIAFLKAHQIDNLAPYHDPKMRLSGALGVQVMPTSVLYDAQGREVWRYVGDADWTSAEAAKLLAEGGGAAH